VMRTLESAALAGEGKVCPAQAETRLFIKPGFQFQVVDAMITNFHLPGSTLLMLVCAFAGYDAVMDGYRQAVAQDYRFFSYGDAMWLELSHV
jgi:S-adenosylmethionine:tRNA ribosyltransferase-isomerase